MAPGFIVVGAPKEGVGGIVLRADGETEEVQAADVMSKTQPAAGMRRRFRKTDNRDPRLGIWPPNGLEMRSPMFFMGSRPASQG